MSLLDISTEMDARTAPRAGGTSPPLNLVVGFDGSPSSLQALRTAQEMRERQGGAIHVIYVAHIPAAASLSAQALAGIVEGFGEIATELTGLAASILGAPGVGWTFQRRDGSVAHELLVAAEKLDQAHGQSTVEIVVGSSEHAYHRVAGSVPQRLSHQDRFALTVVPAPVHGSATGTRYTADWR